MGQRKLLLINKFWHDKGPAGGVGRYLVQEAQDLTAAGWEIIPFGLAEPETVPSPYAEYFVRARDYSRPRLGGGGLADALSLVWNREAARKLDALLAATRPDVAHVHNVYHHLSPSILPVLRRHRVPVVMTLHDLRLLCPAIHMLRDGQVCERCRGGRFHQAVLGRCVKESRAASLLAAVETAHQRARRLYLDNVALFLCPSRFYLEKHVQWEFPRERLRHLPNFVDLEAWQPESVPWQPDRDAYLYFGRISREKGLRHLLDAQHLWERGHADGSIAEPPLRLLIAGSGPCEGNLRARLAQLGLTTAEFLGPLAPDGLRAAFGRARFSVLPSVWYENGPMAAFESLAAGLPVLGSDIGGIPELIEDGVTGVVVRPADPSSLLSGLRRAAALPPTAGAAARRWAETHAGRHEHMALLQEILADAARA